MKTALRFIRYYRRSITPPYTLRDFFPIVGTVLFLTSTTVAMAPLTERVFKQTQEAEVQQAGNVVTTEILSNEFLIKVKKSSNDDVSLDPSVSRVGIKSIEDKNEQNNARDFEELVPRKNKKQLTTDIYSWYKVELPGEGKLLRTGVDEATGELISHNPKVLNLKNIMEQYEKDGNIIDVEPNFTMDAMAIPNALYYSSSRSWGQSYPDLWGLKKIQADAAWDQTTGSTSIVVADIDTGVDRSHEDLAGQMWVNTKEIPNNSLDDDANGYVDDYHGWDWVNNDPDPMDDHGHGTHVAGTIAGVGNNSKGVVGANWTSKIMALKFLSAGGSGSLAHGIAALKYAADMGAKISSNSWGCACNSTAMDDAVKYEHDKGMVMVAAAGNSNADTIDFSPASADRAIAVAASDPNDAKASFSNWGEKIDVAAPGVDILSAKAAINNMCTTSRGNIVGTNYCRVSGTSMATPHVAGLAALLLAKNPDLTNEEVRQILREGSDDLGTTGKDRDFGYGRINAGASMSLAASSYLRPIITTPVGRTTISGTSYNVTGGAAGPRFASYKLEAGLGRSPTSWVTLKDSTTQVNSGVLANINTTSLTDGDYIFRVSATATDGKKYQFQVHDVRVNNVPDIQPPTVNITSPLNGATVSGYVFIIASATDNEKVAKVYFYIDGVLKYIDYYPTYYYYWNSATVSDGSHNLVARAYDEAGNIGTSPTVAVNVSNGPSDTIPPTINITSPANGSTVSGNVNIEATATDNVGVTKVEFLVDGVLKSTDASSPYSYSWDSTAVINGPHTLLVKAYDAAGNTGTSGQVGINVLNDTTPPTVKIIAPVNGATVSNSLYVIAQATDNVKATKVEFYLDGNLVDTDDTPFSDYFWFSWNTAATADGNHTLTAKAYDRVGNTKTDTMAAVVDNTEPNISILSPIAGSIVSGRITLVAGASDNTSVVTKVEFLVDGAVKREDTTAPYDYSWDTTTVINANHSLLARAYDAAGNSSSKSIAVTVRNLKIITLRPVADATISKSYPKTNYGSSPYLIGDLYSPYRNVLMKFSINGIGSGKVTSAKLRLYVQNPSPLGGIFYKTTSTTWSEKTVTWNSRPAVSSKLATLGRVYSGRWYSVDLTKYITKDGTLSLRVISTYSDGTIFYSKEKGSSYAPRLVITVQ